MRRGSISIKWKLMGFTVLLVTGAVVILGWLTYNASEKEIFVSVEQKLREQVLLIKNYIETALAISRQALDEKTQAAQALLAMHGTVALAAQETITIEALNPESNKRFSLTIPTMNIGEQTLVHNVQIVDTIRDLLGVKATICQIVPDGCLRIATNLMNGDGERAVNTLIPSTSPITQALMRGESFSGRVNFFQTWYQGVYRPISDARGTVIGALGLAVPDPAQPILDQLATIIVGKSGYIAILDIAESRKGTYALSAKRQRDGDNVWGAKDPSGRYFLQEWARNAVQLQPGESEIDYYPWKNPGEKATRNKVAAYTYLPGLEWVLVSSAYVDDFQDSLKRMQTLTILVSGGMILLGSAVAYLLALAITKPLRQSVNFARALAHGEFTTELTITQRDETSILGQALNEMRDRIDAVLKEIHALSQAVQQGHLATRGNAGEFAGDWSNLVVGLNTLIEAFMTPIQTTTVYLGRIAHGDISEQVKETFQGDFKVIQENLNLVITTLRSMINEIRSGIEVLRGAVQELTVSSQEIASTSNEQAAAVKEIVSTMEDSDRLAKSIAGKIQEVTGLTVQTKTLVNDGLNVVHDSLGQMDVIKTANAETITGINALGDKIVSIWDIVNMINGIADQTKIIAFNAELEASTAGDAGKNFQIVASEIRRLADSTVASTDEIKTQIDTIQQMSDRLIMTSEEGTKKISVGWELSRSLQKLFEKILESSEASDRSGEQIARSIHQQVSAFEQILLTLKQIAEGIDNFAVSTKATTGAAEHLGEMADQLHAVIDQFRK